MRNKIKFFSAAVTSDVDKRISILEDYLQDTTEIGLELLDAELSEWETVAPLRRVNTATLPASANLKTWWVLKLKHVSLKSSTSTPSGV
mmetsp:Transcript_3248/g.4962  ORF Transcript_3248/g.4962 Transcript_3248/m.4962 type:complete len:89 (-) Transcript_3248:3263-3529(-)